MWTTMELYPRPRVVSPGLRTMSRGVRAALCIILICLPQADTTCSNPDADVCYNTAVSKAQTVNCQSSQIIPELRTCVNAAIGTCTVDVLQFWAKKISDLESSLNNIVATSSLQCNIACPTQMAETQAINTCSLGFSTLLDQIKTGGSKGENVSVYCKSARTAVTCINNAGSCPTTVATRTTLIASYDAVKQYCVTTSSNTGSTSSTAPVSDKPNQTALIIIGILILVIIIINVIIAIVYVYHRRHREVKKVHSRPMASRITHYQ